MVNENNSKDRNLFRKESAAVVGFALLERDFSFYVTTATQWKNADRFKHIYAITNLKTGINPFSL